jgi:3-deoxy-D-manno-octulosonic-acid transferase
MYFLYSLLLALGVVALLPRFILDALRHGKYAAGLSERAGSIAPVDSEGRPVIWLHCVSVGETQAARPLFTFLQKDFPNHALVVSTTTLTGQQLAQDLFGKHATRVFYFPFDWAWSVRRALRAVNPSAVLLMETEIWPRFLHECRSRGVRVAIVNGRISEQSYRRYRLISSFTRRVLADISLGIMQTDSDAERARALGVPTERVKVAGNMKFDSDDASVDENVTAEFRRRFQIDGERPIVLAASTHTPEERIVLEAFRILKRHVSSNIATNPRLMIAPRHPERFAEVATLIERSGFTWARRSAAARSRDAEAEVILLDTIGELRAAYPLAELVFVGGSIAKTGGHNVLEPAAVAKCIVTGAHTFNFKSILSSFLERDAVVQLADVADAQAPDVLARILFDLLTDDARRQQLGENARAALDENRGATSRTVEFLSSLLKDRTTADDHWVLKKEVANKALAADQ